MHRLLDVILYSPFAVTIYLFLITSDDVQDGPACRYGVIRVLVLIHIHLLEGNKNKVAFIVGAEE